MKTQWPPVYDSSFFPTPNEPYWDRKLETMDPGEREQRIILPKLQAQLSYAYENSPFYKRKWDEAGIKPQDIRSLEDFEKLPCVTKEEIRRDQVEYPPFGSNLCVPKKELARVQGTSGTTGKPTAFGISRGDMARIAEAHARIMWGFGVRQDDMSKIMNSMAFSCGESAVRVAQHVGNTVLPVPVDGSPGKPVDAESLTCKAV